VEDLVELPGTRTLDLLHAMQDALPAEL